MRVSLGDDEAVSIDMAPLIDCVFLLLIFFLVATTFKKKDAEEPPKPDAEVQRVEELKVMLPDRGMASGENLEKTPISIGIDYRGTFYLGTRSVTRTVLQSRIRDIAANESFRHVRVEVDRRAPSAGLIELLDLFAYNGIHDYGIHTKTSGYGIAE